MIYVTGDTYGDVERFKKCSVRLKKDDTVIVCGNFGFFCDKDKLAQKSLDWLTKQKYTIAFLHGAIDDAEWLKTFPLTDWNGGKAAKIRENIFWLPQGEIYEIEGKRLFCFGGGENLDYLGDNYSEEFYTAGILSEELKLYTLSNLAMHDNQVDFYITHDAPSKLRTILLQRKGEINPLRTQFHQFLDTLWENGKFSGWYFGKYRINHNIAPIYHCVYDAFVPLNPKKKK